MLGERDDLGEGTEATRPPVCSQLFPDTGVAVLRDGWDREANFMVVDFGRCIGGHAYPARSSFSLWLGGRPAALSPGSYISYSNPLYRDWCHTTRSQNTVMIDDLDQEQWVTPGQRVQGEILRWVEDADSVLLQGGHDGYLASVSIRHTRTVMMASGMFLVHDVLDATAAAEDHTGRWSLHCPEPWVEVEEETRLMAGPGLIRVAPAWPERISGVETGSEGIAAYPGVSEDGTIGAYRQLNQLRYRFGIAGGSVTHFAAVISPDSGAGEHPEVLGAELSAAHMRLRMRVGEWEGNYELPMPGAV